MADVFGLSMLLMILIVKLWPDPEYPGAKNGAGARQDRDEP
ncbi:hypothetical protein M2387_004526 [Klebsiella sp. BIGb0407]|nr:hypothetical protein [Klebsiella sp. BIGb0407]